MVMSEMPTVKQCIVCQDTDGPDFENCNYEQSLCPECASVIERGLIFLVVIENDVTKLDKIQITEEVSHAQMELEDAERTGDIMVVNDKVYREIFQNDPPDHNIAFINPGAFDRLTEIAKQHPEANPHHPDNIYHDQCDELNAECGGKMNPLPPKPLKKPPRRF